VVKLVIFYYLFVIKQISFEKGQMQSFKISGWQLDDQEGRRPRSADIRQIIIDVFKLV
jgi:hypothetical protein